MYSKKGQSLMELVIVVAVVVTVVGALVFATIASLRNAQFAKNQAQATKLAQEGLEKIRSLRNRDEANKVDYTRGDGTHTSKFSDLWSISFTCGAGANCYFYFNSSGTLVGGTSVNFELPTAVPPNFKRQFQIEDNDGGTQKKVTAKVLWTDFAGEHESKLTTILRKI